MLHCCRKTLKDDLERSKRASSANAVVTEAGRTVPRITPISANRMTPPTAASSVTKSRNSSSTVRSLPVCGDSFFDDKNEPDQSRGDWSLNDTGSLGASNMEAHEMPSGTARISCSNWSFSDTVGFNVSNIQQHDTPSHLANNSNRNAVSFSFAQSALEFSSFDVSDVQPPRDTPAISNSMRSSCQVSPAAVSTSSSLQRSLLSELQMCDVTGTRNAKSPLRSSFPSSDLKPYGSELQSTLSDRNSLPQSVVKAPRSTSSLAAAVTIPAGLSHMLCVI